MILTTQTAFVEALIGHYRFIKVTKAIRLLKEEEAIVTRSENPAALLINRRGGSFQSRIGFCWGVQMGGGNNKEQNLVLTKQHEKRSR